MAPSGRIKVAIANDYEVVVRGVQAMLTEFPARVEIVELDVDVPVAHDVDVTLYDTFSETQVDASDIDELLAAEEAGAVVVYTWNMHPQLVEVALGKGCRGYLDKALGGGDLLSALERIADGDIVISPTAEPGVDVIHLDPDRLGGDWPGRAEGLSAREGEIVALITQGLTNADIAARTYLSINSVKTYIRSCYRRIGVTSRSQAVLWGVRHGFLPDRERIFAGEDDLLPG